MKFTIETTFDFAKLRLKMKDIVKKTVSETLKAEAVDMKDRIGTGTTIHGTPMEKIEKSATITRILRRQKATSPPLNASGKLYESIKARKGGISAAHYGEHHDTGFRTFNNPVIPKGRTGGGLKKRKFTFNNNGSGTAIPSRRWLHDNMTFRFNKRVIKKMWSRIANGLKKR